MLHPKRDIWGREIQRSGTGWEGFVSPVWFSEDAGNTVDKELKRLGAGISTPSKTIGSGDNKRKLTPSEYDEYTKEAGEAAFTKVENYINSDQYKKASDEIRIARIKSLVSRARRIARRGIGE